MTYRPDIDGLRAFAVLSVVAYHADPARAPGGFAGVDVFFVISGFLITSLLLESKRTGSFSIRSFYARRLRRLAPSLAVVLAATIAAGWVWLSTEDLAQLGTHVAASAAFVMNFVLWGETGYFDRAAEQKPLLHLWSLGVEEQFYLLWPALLALTVRRARPSTVVGAVAALSFAANVLTLQWSPATAFYWPTTRLWELALGGVLACVRLPSAAAARNACAVAGALLLTATVVLLRGDATFPGWWALLPALGAALTIAAGPQAWFNRLVLARPLFVFVGLISYPLYLWHWPILTFARLLTADSLSALAVAILVAVAFVLSWLCYRFVEKPLRHGSSRWVVPGLAGALACACAAGLALRVQATSLPARFPAEVQALADFSYRYEPVYRERVCYLTPDQPPAALAPECIERQPAGAPLVVLWGDSHAAHLYPGLHWLQGQQPFRLAEFAGSRCPPLLDVETPTQPFCQEMNRTFLDALARLRPATVMLAARWRLYPLETLDRTVDAVRRAAPSSRVVVVGPVPQWNTRLPQVLLAYHRDHPREPVPARTAFGLAPYVWDFEQDVRGRVERAGAEYASAMNALCTREGCVTKVPEGSDGLTTWDEAHLTASGSMYLAARLAPRILPRR